MQLLESFVEAGKLHKADRQNARHYAPVEGCFGK